MGTLSRFVRWQIASRLMPAKIALPFVDGFCLFTSNGMTGATANWYCGLCEPNEMAFVLHALRKGQVFIDVGANIGSYTVLAAAAGASVIAIEPLPATYAHLQTNVIANELSQTVVLICCGLSGSQGRVKFTTGKDTMNRIALPEESLEVLDLPVDTLDNVCSRVMPTIIKVDVEGHELAVLKGGSNVLAEPSLAAVIVETNSSGLKYGISDIAIFDEMQKFGFQPCSYNAISRTIERSKPGSSNTIFVRDPSALQEICREARKFALSNGSI